MGFGGKGKRGGGGVSMQQMQQMMRMMGGGKGGGGRKGGGKRQGGKKRVPFSELPEEKQQEIRERQEARTVEEGRQESGSQEFTGILVSRVRHHGWIKPQNAGQLPKDVQSAMRKMCNENKGKCEDKSSDIASAFGKGVLYVRMSDCEPGLNMERDMKVRFRCYTDNQGAGAFDVTAA